MTLCAAGSRGAVKLYKRGTEFEGFGVPANVCDKEEEVLS